MRKALDDTISTSSSGFSMPAPIGGWNARDALPNMPATDAVILDNWFPSTTTVGVRPGSKDAATLPANTVPSPHNIRSLLHCAKADGTLVRFAVAEGGVYNITAGGAIAAPAYVTTDNRIESVNITVGGIAYLWNCNGVDKAFLYKSDTGTFIPLDEVSVPALTGITSTAVANVALWKYRVILCKKNSLSFFYGPLNSVGDAFAEFPLGAIFKRGGYIVATTNWTVDAGDGPDDRFVVITSEGEVAIYQGTDPSATATFSIVGVYNLGKPTGKRCFVTLASDVGVLTEQGLWPLSKALQSSTIDKRPALTDKIQEAFNAFYRGFGALHGWQAVLLPKGPALIVNVPISATLSYQFVMNTITGAWCRFISWNASCIMVADGKLYFASVNKVYEGWTGVNDSNAAISAFAKQAFTYGPSRTRIKHVKLVRPIVRAEGTITLQCGLDSDFSSRTATPSSSGTSVAASVWDTAIYGTALWSGSLTIKSWRTVSHTPGKAWAFRMRTNVKGIAVSWSNTDYISENGGLFG